jgi:hypothetical protein
MHPYRESLEALTEPSSPKLIVVAKLSTRRVTVLPPNYASLEQKDLAVFICKVKTVQQTDVAVYHTEGKHMLFAKQYLTGNAAVA